MHDLKRMQLLKYKHYLDCDLANHLRVQTLVQGDLFKRATRTVLQDEVDVLVVGLGVLDADEVGETGAEVVEPVEDLFFDEGLVELVDLTAMGSTLMTCFFEIFLIAYFLLFLLPSNTSPNAPSPSFCMSSRL